MRYNDFETMSIYTVENFTSDITVEGYIAEFRDEPHFLELCVNTHENLRHIVIK